MLRQVISKSFLIRRIADQTFQQCKNMGNIKTHTPNNLEKKFLVWSGKYKNVADVPAHVSPEEMERCRNKVRIRLANIMMGLTVVGCIIMVYSGKQAAKRGDSVVKQNYDWHKRYNEQHQEKTPTN